MSLLSLQDAELAFGLHPLLDRASLVVADGERIGLIGRNGTGKSSLLKVIAGLASLDDGQIKRRDGLSVVLVEQGPELPRASSLRGRLDGIADERERWRTEARLVEFLHRFGLDEATAPESASGGEKKRAALALALALTPDLLLLDEPTNHLDLDGIALVWSSRACSSPIRRAVSSSVPRPDSMPTPSPKYRRAYAGACCAASSGVACCQAMTHGRWGNGNTTVAFPSTRRCASRPLTAPGASVCCVTVPGHPSPWTGCANSIPNACSTRPPSPVRAGAGHCS